MAPGTTTHTLAFIQLNVGVLSIIGLCNVLVGLMVAGISGGFTALLLVPIIASAACALAQGLDYIKYTDYPVVNKAVANVFANLGWTVSLD
ncbi:hypothetical protein VFPPC_18213 [Pochonia chlamydosporia 170]|uniref:Uncharacterized protein n=1 Tax=Pochonia chlamydosporia 170 TaxID=1380566 RepID=A0A179EXD4_METCM|nr:hypothetical protein VFPPC_12528 [Pochonia chlamydosporia 170]XP_022285138.1 hypothetical protein VFPPC_18213 [Pochonia chlamydosporia 170]OAQ57513.2 hypothetical protein VFPPC_12528 [Pochonia chlamydosporia 170]OWT42653.1 hypothetical protein VFPPC_18213 [Pochonia chlamydosporia 170]